MDLFARPTAEFRDRARAPTLPPCLPSLGPFRGAVSDLVREVAQVAPTDTKRVERILRKRLDQDDFAAVIEATPDGRNVTVAKLLFEVRNYEPTTQNATGTLAALVRISMLAQIDAVWWGRTPSYQNDDDLRDAAELVDLDKAAETGQLRFCYRHQPITRVAPAARSAERRGPPRPSPPPAAPPPAPAHPPPVARVNKLPDASAQVHPR